MWKFSTMLGGLRRHQRSKYEHPTSVEQRATPRTSSEAMGCFSRIQLCTQCGKRFDTTYEGAMNHSKWFCNFHCVHAYDKQQYR